MTDAGKRRTLYIEALVESLGWLVAATNHAPASTAPALAAHRDALLEHARHWRVRGQAVHHALLIGLPDLADSIASH